MLLNFDKSYLIILLLNFDKSNTFDNGKKKPIVVLHLSISKIIIT